MSYLLILTSLLLGLLGTFTKTFADEQRRKLTGWGKVVGVLLLVSAGLTAFDQFRSARARDKERRAEQASAESMRRTLSQQRLITLAALSTGFQLARPPLVMFSYPLSVDADDERYGAEYQKLEQFPGFGTPLAGYQLRLDLNDERAFSYEHGEVPREGYNPGGLRYAPDPLPEEMGHTFQTGQYRTLDEVIFDFRPGREVGELRLWKEGGRFQPAEVARVREWLSPKRGTFYVQADITRRGSNLVYTHLQLPITLDRDTVEGGLLTFKLTVGDPEVTSYDHAP